MDVMTTTSEKRQRFRAAIGSGSPVMVPLCLDPMTARLCEELGFQAGYLSGGALGFQLAVSEALLTVTELAGATAAISRRSGLPMIVDGGVGFGDPVHVARMMWEFEAAGAVAVELEDQIAPKRVSHHRGVEHLVPPADMVAKIRMAVAARQDPDFLVIARTGAVRNEDFDAAIERGKAYFDAGADLVMLFPQTDDQWGAAAGLLPGPVAVMAALDARLPAEWASLGFAVVIDPFTGQVAAFDAVRSVYQRQLTAADGKAELAGRFAIYRELPGVAGLDELYDIERATTEPGT
jgi:methylisocitrate lyase